MACAMARLMLFSFLVVTENAGTLRPHEKYRVNVSVNKVRVVSRLLVSAKSLQKSPTTIKIVNY